MRLWTQPRQIEVELPARWPEELAILREVGGRIPWTAGRHINHDGAACPLVPEEWLLSPQRESLLAFLDGPVRNFFLGQSLVERGEPLIPKKRLARIYRYGMAGEPPDALAVMPPSMVFIDPATPNFGGRPRRSSP